MEDQKNSKQRKRIPGLVPIRDKRKRKIPELKERSINFQFELVRRCSLFKKFSYMIIVDQKQPLNASSQAKIQRDSLIPLKIDFSLIREKQKTAPKLESLNKVQVTKSGTVSSVNGEFLHKIDKIFRILLLHAMRTTTRHFCGRGSRAEC